MPAPKNRFKHALKEGRPQIGLWQALANPYTVEICAEAGAVRAAVPASRPASRTAPSQLRPGLRR